MVSVQRIYSSNLGQFLQVNDIEASYNKNYDYRDMRRVATEVFSKNLKANSDYDVWERRELAFEGLFEKERKSAFVVRLQGRNQHGYPINSYKLLISTDMGLTAKWSDNKLYVFVSSIRNSGPVAGARVALYSHQLQEMASSVSDSDGRVVFDNGDDKALFIAAEKGEDRSYLKAFRDSWRTGTFETGGVRINSTGIKAYIYTERGVYRPGDTVNVSCIARNRDGDFPDGHPVTLKLYDPRGQLRETQVSNKNYNGLYCFTLAGNSSDMTGSWQAELLVGDCSFRKEIKIETVIPNRLKVEQSFPDTVGMEKSR